MAKRIDPDPETPRAGAEPLRDDEKIAQIKAIVNDGNPALIAALKDLASYVPQGGHFPLEKVSEITTGGDYYNAGDEKQPFFTEVFLYDLLGKGDARTVLALLRDVTEAAGLDRSAIF